VAEDSEVLAAESESEGATGDLPFEEVVHCQAPRHPQIEIAISFDAHLEHSLRRGVVDGRVPYRHESARGIID